jgi:hypothetical protein
VLAAGLPSFATTVEICSPGVRLLGATGYQAVAADVSLPKSRHRKSLVAALAASLRGDHEDGEPPSEKDAQR